ncbi:hypothetical protein F5B22DRAFT_647387 [Xylaria bambusicola]|uniref:uncharacterized protein n=1 Tax=Xylaria bambusicola TaxID=326684 RepID=UPI00200853CB|nr:uncharacterized protein F5B22DRAFT_647387 [Xylaria bambusicola]KAI0514632.1 hypothetical protein F5B22DRAFT_647387 [Xylaria bambusicola]
MLYSLSGDISGAWEKDPDMRERTEKYRKRALSIAQNIGLSSHLWTYSSSSPAQKIGIFENKNDQHDQSENHSASLNDVRERIVQWEDALRHRKDNKSNGRVILLEGPELSPRLLELLGVILNIPPHFFLGHNCGDWHHSAIDAYFKQDTSMYWKVQVPLVPQTVSVEPGLRQIGQFHVIQKTTTYNNVSYWTRSFDHNSWTAVILVDAKDSKRGPSYRYGTRSISMKTSFHEILETAATKSDYMYQSSIFGAVVASYSTSKIPTTNDPFEGSILIRNIIRSCWEEVVASLAAQIAFRARTSYFRPAIYKGIAAKAYEHSLHSQLLIAEFKDLMSSIMWKFRCKDTDIPQHNSNALPDSATNQPNVALRDALKREKNRWLMLHERLINVEITMAKLMDIWVQQAAVEQTAAATRLARTSGQLAKIATIVVPCNCIATIFSMNGRFAVGKELFYVYWIISIPITLGLLFWVLYRDVMEMFKRFRNRYRER